MKDLQQSISISVLNVVHEALVGDDYGTQAIGEKVCLLPMAKVRNAHNDWRGKRRDIAKLDYEISRLKMCPGGW